MPAILDHGFSISTFTGLGGSGKSFAIVWELANRRMVNRNYKLVTNLSLTDQFYELVAELKGCTVEEVKARVLIPDEKTVEEWKRGESYPWDLDIDGPWDFVWDEVHEIIPKKATKQNESWNNFLAKARKYDCQRIQFITQTTKEISDTIYARAKVRYLIEKMEVAKVQYLGIEMIYLYELYASFTGYYVPQICRVEERQDVKEKWVETDRTYFTLKKKGL